ncbi:hypothetical protein Tco_0690772 [Tanacetum coccineum]
MEDPNVIKNIASEFTEKIKNIEGKPMMGDDGINLGTKSFVNVVTTEKKTPKINFRTLINNHHVENSDCALPVENVIDGNGADKVTKVPVWVKIHKVHVVAYSKDGLSLIVTQIGKLIILDAFTSSMCVEPLGRLGFARALIEVTVEKELKKKIIMVVPIVDGEGHTMEQISVEYEWKPPQCMDCKVFGHASEEYPKWVIKPVKDTNAAKNDGFTNVHNRKKKGKKVDNQTSKPTSSKPTDVVNLKNPFDALQDHDETENVHEVGEVLGLNRTPKQSEVRQVVSENQLSVCAILESHVDLTSLSRVYSKVLCAWEWTSNASLCTKGNDPMERRCLWGDLGIHFTWNQKPKGGGGILKKLDRIMGNFKFIDMFQGAYALFQSYRISDHSLAA